MRLVWSKNKKGAALVYAIMVLLLLATVIVALTALSTASYTDAVLAVSDDQSYYYAKSIGLAVKEQFKDGYNIARILASLDEQEAMRANNKDDCPDPKVTGTFNIANKNGGLVEGTVQIRYARDEDDNVNTHIIEVRSACVVNNSVAAVTSIFSCEDETGDELNYLKEALTDYDVILTDTNNLSFDFAQSSDSSSSKLSVYVYAGEDDNVTNPVFNLGVDLAGKLTTTGKTTISATSYRKITGNLTGYGDLTLNNVGVDGGNGVHCDGDVTLTNLGFVKNNIYARGKVTIGAVPTELNWSYVSSYADSSGGGYTYVAHPDGWSAYHSAKNIYAQGNVSVGARAWVTGSIYSHGNVTVTGKGAVASGAYNLGYHAGNTLVEGSIYSEGDVIIANGAIVKGSVYANGNVYIKQGATVVGNVQSVSGNVYVWGSIVGAQVNCPKGTLQLNNVGDDQFCAYLIESERDPKGRIIFGGIGVFQPNDTIYKHTCNTLSTADCEFMSQIRGNLYVENPTSSDYTPLLSIWAHGAIYLNNSTARFVNSADPHGYRTYHGENSAGNPYTYIAELNQKLDFYGTADKPYVKMWGAHIVTLNIGSKKTSLLDGYLFDGWVGNVNARCLYLADMQLDGYVFASQYLQVWGTGSAYTTANYNRVVNGESKAYTYARDGVAGNGITYAPNYITFEVACLVPSYSGKLHEDRIGCDLLQRTELYCLVNVGSEETDETDNSRVTVGSEDAPGTTRFYGGINAYVKNFTISASARLSTKQNATDPGTLYSATILAEVFNLFYVQPSTSAGYYRYNSLVQVKGNAYIAGWLYTFEHFVRDDGTGTFTNEPTARIKGVFRSTGTTLNLQGTECFTDVEATNTTSVTTMTGTLTVNSLKLNGSFKMTDSSHSLKVNGDMYVRNWASKVYSAVTVTGKLTINTTSETDWTPAMGFDVGGDFYLGKNNLVLNKSSHQVKGKVETKGNITISGGATIYGAKTTSSKTLTISGGNLKGDFDVGTFILSSGTAARESVRIYGKAVQYTHTGGAINRADIIVTGNSPTAVSITGTSSSKPTADSVFINAANGGASVTGGSNVSYTTGALRAYLSSTIAAGFQMGISIRNGNLQIGSTSTTSESYKVGTVLQSSDPDSDAYRIIYASGNIDWGYGARATYDNTVMYCDLTRISAGGNITMGRSNYFVPGRFSAARSANGYVELYVEKIDDVYAKNTSWVHVSNALGMSANSDTAGFKVISGDAYVYGKTGSEYLRGHNQASGVFHVMTQINAEGCLIKCQNIDGLGNFKNDSDGCKPISLRLTNPPKTDGYYELTSSIAGAFTVEQSNLKYAYPVKVKGELCVPDGIILYKKNGASSYSSEDLQCLGGLRCNNEKVNITSDFKGNVHLPNVTTLKLNADVGVNAPKVTNFELNINITHSLNLSSCNTLTIAAGRTVSGSVIIKSSGRIINNGTIGESVQCGVYEGSGTVGKDLITLNSSDTSSITGAGKVTGNIWTKGSININSTGTFGKSGSYIYSQKNITIENAKFTSGMNYIMSSGGYILMTNCAGFVPKVYNTSGYIRFINTSEANRSLIAGIVSTGTFIDFGETDNSDGTGYQTVTGALHWDGNYSGNAVDFRNGAHTIIQGAAKLIGTGNVALRKATLSALTLANSGTVSSDSACTIANLWIASAVTSVNISGKVTGNVTYSCNSGSSGTVVTLGNVGGYIEGNGCKSITVNGTVGSYVNARGATNLTLNKAVSSYVTITNGTLTTNENATIGGNLRGYDANMYINADVGGYVLHTAHNISSSYPIKTVVLGNQKKEISVGGKITVHGKLVDNSKQTVANSEIFCKGTYYADLMKSFANCKKLNFTTEAGGPCVIVGAKGNDWTINTEINVIGRFAVYTVWNEKDNAYYKVTFTKQVKANSLVINSKPAEALGYSDGFLRAAPQSKVIRYTKNENSGKAQGLDKHAWMEDLVTCSATWTDIYYDALTDVATSKELVVFNKPVYISINDSYGYNGTVHIANTKFASGSTLYSDGQTCMKYCCLYSKGWSSATKHCTVPASPNGLYVTFLQQGYPAFEFDGSMFVHCYREGGDNYFSNVTTNSHVGIYLGNNYILDNSEFKGCTVTDTSGYYGHTATVLMYFGKSTFFDSGAHILTAADLGVDLPAARTIVWVNTGTLFVGTNSYIGNNSRKSKSPNYANLNTNRYSFHPGIFVSENSTENVSYKAANGTTYSCEKGSIEVVGSVTLDIMAYRAINIWKDGVVVAKEYSSTKDKKYKAGLYVSTGYVWMQKSDGGWAKGESNPSGGGWFGLFDATSGGRNYHVKNDNSQVTDATAYVPNGEGYAAQIRRRYTSTADANAWCYTPWADIPWAFHGANTDQRYSTGVGSTNMTATAGTLNVTIGQQVDSIPSNPSQPTISASGGLNTNGDASVNPLNVNNVNQPEGPATARPDEKSISASKASAPASSLTFAGGKANASTLVWSNPGYSPSGVTPKHPSAEWTSSIKKHFDKTEEQYWNTRYIPYVWKLPYYDASGNSTYAKKVLKSQSADIEVNGHMMLKQTSSTGYYTNQAQYSGSSLAGKAGSIFGWRSSGVADKAALYDFLVLNSYPEWDGPFDKDPDHKRRTKILVFESGELPYSAFFMGGGTGSEDYASWYGASSNKTIRTSKQKAWKLGDPDVSFYDGSLVFYTCADPSNPYGSAAKDLHIVLPQGIGFDFVVDAENTVTVVGNGRLFLYLTSGDTIYFRAKATDSVYANPVGGLKDNGNGTYSPLMYIIGAGTNIDLYIDRMALSAFVYMPFGSTSELYDYTNGSLKQYNTFKNANGSTFSSLYSGTGQTTTVGRNTLHMLWDGSAGNARNVCGTIVADKFDYVASSNCLNFKNYSDSSRTNRAIVPDFSDTKIYDRSTKNGSSTKLGSYKTYSLATFLTNAPNYSTSLLNWEYKGIKVEG